MLICELNARRDLLRGVPMSNIKESCDMKKVTSRGLMDVPKERNRAESRLDLVSSARFEVLPDRAGR